MTEKTILTKIDEQIKNNLDWENSICSFSERVALRQNNDLLGVIKHEIKNIDKSYERGCDDAWELARKMAFMTEKERDRITGWGTLGCMLDNLDYKDVHNMVEYYEEHKKLKPGDVVMYKCGGDFEKAILLYENENFYWVIKELGGCPQNLPKDLFRLDKTYKHVNLEGLFEEFEEE